jgi:hypothetical protein
MVLVAASFHSCEKEEDFDETLLIGKWKETGASPFHYRYDSNHNGVRWKPSEDVLESEGENFTWELEKSELMRLHIRKNDGGKQPEGPFTITELTATSLKYKNESRSYSFTKYTD